MTELRKTSVRLRIIRRIKKLVLKHHFSVENIDLNAWGDEVDEQSFPLLAAEDDQAFEDGVHRLLSKLKSSHTDFYRQRRSATRPEHTIGATVRQAMYLDGLRWMLQDVFEDSPAARAGLFPGQLLLKVDGSPTIPPEVPVFRFGEKHELIVGLPDSAGIQKTIVRIPKPKVTMPRLPFVEPKSVTHKMLTKRVGIVRIAYFSGMFGIRFSRLLDAAMVSLKTQGCDRLIVDLRGCLGGSLGFARLVSYFCPHQIPIGYDVTRRRQREGYDASMLPRVVMPRTRLAVLFRLAEFSVRDKSLILLTQGLGNQPFHGRIAILINEFTSSAGEMVAQFAKDTKLAVLVGQKTPGLVLGSAMFNVGSGYTLYLPVFGWFSPDGRRTEGFGVTPDISVDIDPPALVHGHDAQLNRALEILQ